MKKLLCTVVIMMLCLFALPALTISGMSQWPEQASDELPQIADPELEKALPDNDYYTVPPSINTEMEVQNTLGFDDEQSITLLHDDHVHTLSMRDYLIGVLIAEMPAAFPEEALKAQAVAARTFTLYTIDSYGDNLPDSHDGAQLCSDSSHCKAYGQPEVLGAQMWDDDYEYYLERIVSAVDDTDGLIMVYDDQPIAAVFHSMSVGMTESSVDVWGGDYPYLVAVESPNGDELEHSVEKVVISGEQFAENIRQKHPDADFSGDMSTWFNDSNRSEADRVIDLLVGGVRMSGGDVRAAAGLSSTNFRVAVDDEDLVFTVTGRGHGVGMSQYGARELAEQGASFDEILRHYYTGIQILLKG